MTSAHLYATEYDQPRPIDGVYEATVFENHAEFQYMGRKVIAKSVKDPMHAHNNVGTVVVRGFLVDISWNGVAPCKTPAKAISGEREYSFEGVLIASLLPEFDQPHPFSEKNFDFKSRAKYINIEFGYPEKYYAILDGHTQFAVKDAPCTIRPIEGSPLKCLVVFDNATIFMAKRYGQGSYEQLVASTVNELQGVLSTK
jgi:hypothetical protein